MDKYTLQELAYRNGYAAGLADGVNNNRSQWIYGDNSEIICKACGTRQARFYGSGEAVPRDEQNFCHYCGSLNTYDLF